MALEILYQDQNYVAINKPAGLLVHRTSLAYGEAQCVVQNLRDQLGLRVYPIHRLDRPTSGVLVLGLSSDAARALSLEFSERRVEKKYIAIVRGIPPQEVRIDYPLKEELDDVADSKARRDKEPQKAITEVTTLASIELPVQVDRYPTSRYSLVRAIPKTGRKHQIRRHLRHLGHPIIGDVNHGVGKHNRFFKSEFGTGRLLLACTEMRFKNPINGQDLSLSASLCEKFQGLIDRFSWTY